MPGKLNGVMTATTPTGWRIISSSMPDAMSSRLLPIISDGMPVATSTFSMPRFSSPSDSASVLPHSCVISLAISVKLRVEQRLEPEERLDAIAGRRAAPRLQRLRCGIDGLGDVSGARKRRLGQHVAGGRIPNGDHARRGRRLPTVRRRNCSTMFLARSLLLLWPWGQTAAVTSSSISTSPIRVCHMPDPPIRSYGTTIARPTISPRASA